MNLRLRVAASSVVLVAGCACTENALPSVTVSVVDGNGAYVYDATVAFTLDGGATEEVPCGRVDPSSLSTSASASTSSGSGAGTDKCIEWDAGSEQTGTFVVRATSADGTKTAQAEVHVGKNLGACHINPQSLKLVLR